VHHPGTTLLELDQFHRQAPQPQEPGGTDIDVLNLIRSLRTLDHARDLTFVTMNCFDTAMITEVTGPSRQRQGPGVPGQVR